ncbi:hypothetical protein BGW37DRAFT_503358 [Umbelopsis sp. PMI_123]|nr:hypothetical protein BGW37DRAFT_503358 [Umbelopsis sp. PMI_123]
MADIRPPFTRESANKKVKFAQDSWNTCNPHKVCKGYSQNCVWRNRDKFFQGQEAIIDFLTDKWSNETNYRLRKELFAFTDNQIAVNFWYEFKDKNGKWWRAYGLEHWRYGSDGKMVNRQMSGNNVEISETDRWFKDGVDVNEVNITEGHGVWLS